MNNELRKDLTPKETIKKIKKILKENKINIKENKTKCLYKNFYSTRIEIKGFYHLGTNGKGITKDLALASAYAELMERLQSKMLINTYYLGKVKNLISYNDETIKKNYIVKNLKILTSFFESDVNLQDFFKKNNKFSIVSKYKNLITEKEEYLPSKLINATSFSNGLCAGNSFYEAINQGICEILERNSYQEILNKEIILDNIIIEKDLPIYNKIKAIKENGFNIQIKDCSLKKYPVVGVYITNKDKTKYIFTIGSDPNINIAVQRCLTEAFQGLKNKKDLIFKMKKTNNTFYELNNEERKMNWFKNYSSNNGIHPTKIFQSNKFINYKNLKYFSNIKTNKEIFNFLINIIKSNNLSIYIKDFSYLGFNTYKIYIPILSNIDTINNNEKDLIKNYNFLKSIYFNLNNYNNKKDLKKASNIIERSLKSDKSLFINLGNYFHASNYIKTNYNNITFEFLYILIKCKIHENINYKLIKNKNLINYIKSINSNNKYEYIINDLNLLLPTCPNCTTCPIKKKCCYKTWKHINNVLIFKEEEYFHKNK